jgi:DNA-binding GntR family transcriptional regulator
LLAAMTERNPETAVDAMRRHLLSAEESAVSAITGSKRAKFNPN